MSWFLSGGVRVRPPHRPDVPPPPPGNVPGRLQAWQQREHPFSLGFLEAVLRHVGLGEVHKAIALFLDTPPAHGGPRHTQRYPPSILTPPLDPKPPP